jgi:hypothetical protein
MAPGPAMTDAMARQVKVPADRPLVLSPFGVGVLDLAFDTYVHDEVFRSGELHVTNDFSHNLH